MAKEKIYFENLHSLLCPSNDSNHHGPLLVNGWPIRHGFAQGLRNLSAALSLSSS